MTKSEFKQQYYRMKDIYGERSKGHAAEWYLQFGGLSFEEFQDQVTKVIKEHQSFAWPTPGQFDLVVNGPWTEERRAIEFAKTDTTYSDLRRRIDGAS